MDFLNEVGGVTFGKDCWGWEKGGGEVVRGREQGGHTTERTVFL